MVFILDEGGVFQVPLDQIWAFFGDMAKHAHPTMKNMHVEPAGENALNMSWEGTVNNSITSNKAKLTMFPPSGFAMEFTEGPFTGTKEFEYYIPKGNQTGITSVGVWMSPILNDDQLKKEAMNFLDTVFREDEANFARMKK